MINFPVLNKVIINNYQLYAGTSECPGLNHTFQDGVNIIVGINGLGKTTLLNILLRAISGPFDFPQGDQLGNTRRTMVGADRAWFRRRVPDDAVQATVEVEFWIGEDFFRVKRSLHNLELLTLSLNQQDMPKESATDYELKYQYQIQHSSNLSRYDDFIFLLRYLIFFLEDRRSLVWDPAAQAEALGILFGESSERHDFISHFNKLASLDSEYRNTRAIVNRYIKTREKNISTLTGGQIDMLIKELDSDQNKLKDFNDIRENLEKERESLRGAIENSQREAFDRRSKLAKQLDSYYESFFPNLEDSARYLLSHFESGSGCLICGTNSIAAKSKVIAKLQVNSCPICESLLENGNEKQLHDPFASEFIENERISIEEIQNNIVLMEEKLENVETRFSQNGAERSALADKIRNYTNQLDDLGHSSPAVKQALERVETEISALNNILKNLEIEIERIAIEFRKQAQSIDVEVKLVSDSIEKSFAKFISGFLAEDCKIAYTTKARRVGIDQQGGLYPFPHFLPALTSGVFRHGEMVRQTSESVSESQKEFIDLAFRMAILEIAAPNHPAMIILETPEASLDSVFVPRAANLLRSFATRDNNAKSTRLIASTNVNRELMIPALFGVYPDLEFQKAVTTGYTEPLPEPVDSESRYKHVLDLLTIAAPTRALEEFRIPYELERDKAIYPEKFLNPSTS